MDYGSLEVVTALRALGMASALCEKVRADLPSQRAILKSDRSPVTVADFGSQAIVCKHLKEKFPNDVIIAEEDSEDLKKPDHSKVLEQVTHYVNLSVPSSSSNDVCSWIDFSTHSTADRFWTLDPIDGTKGFLRGDQYAIALALIENGAVKLGLLACPNLYQNLREPQGKRGCLFIASRGDGSFQMDIGGAGKRGITVSRIGDPSKIVLTESVEPDHADHLFHERLAEKLHISTPSLRMDSQAKYGIVARGDAAVYLRVPSPSQPDYREKIWDHAAGAIIAEEAGGKVTDVRGLPLDFSAGTTLEKNRGILVTNGRLHETVLKALGIEGCRGLEERV
jgi:3'(2'), 5'-bisphosphate nucleotidase